MDNPGFELSTSISNDLQKNNTDVENSPIGIAPSNDSEENVLRMKNSNILYGVMDVPPWYTCILLAIQHFFMMIESAISVPYLLTPLMCMEPTNPGRGYVTATALFASGVVTLLQTTIGVRLPIVQGSAHSFINPVIVILSLMPCPSDEEMDAKSTEEKDILWKSRMVELQGAFCVAACLQMLIGFTGLIGALKRWITPLVVAPTISLIGLSLINVAADKCSPHWGIAALTFGMIILFSQYLTKVEVPFLTIKDKSLSTTRVQIFKLFPVFLAVVISWLLCFILTITDVFDKSSGARTDTHLDLVQKSPWFRIPYPGQWGTPSPTLAGSLGLFAGVFATIIESTGDYYACARLSAAPTPPSHALNRGVGIEGLGTLLAAVLGSGSATTSYSQNISAIAVTGVGSRRVIQCTAGLLILCGVIPKIGSFFINVPEPIIGGLFMVVFGLITSVGVSTLQYVDLNSPRNLTIFGFSIFMGLSVTSWMKDPSNSALIQTTVPGLDQVIKVLFQIPMFVGGIIGFFLDNTIPGTKKERGIEAWDNENSFSSCDDDGNFSSEVYDLPFGMEAIRRWKYSRYIPISPTFRNWTKKS